MSENREKAFDILQAKESPQVRDALRDLIMLAGVLKDLSAERFWDEVHCVHDTMRVFDLLLKSTFYEEQAIQGDQELVYRFQKEYGTSPSIDIMRLVRLGRRYNWITDAHNPPLKFTGTGKRMVGQLFRLANDALVYHSQAPELKEIYQAERDLQLARAYEDIGVGKHDTVASVLNNIENAINDLRYMREKYIQDRRALEKYQSAVLLLDMLEKELEKRFAVLEGLIDRKLERQHRRSATLFYRLLQELSALLGDNAYLSQLEVGRKIIQVDRKKFIQYLVDAYAGTLQGLALSPLQVLEYQEEGVYSEDGEDDEVFGLWLPFTLPFFIHEDDVAAGALQIEEWAEKWAPPPEEHSLNEVIYQPARQVTALELSKILGASTSIAAELATDTRPLVEAVRRNQGISIHDLLDMLAASWGDAVRQMFVLGYLVHEGEVKLFTLDSDPVRPEPAGRWQVCYPDGKVRYVKGTFTLGRHLERIPWMNTPHAHSGRSEH